MRTNLILILVLTLLYSSSFTQPLEALCEPVTILINDPYVKLDFYAKDLISSIEGGTAPFTFAFYTPRGPDHISLSCLDEGSIELEVNVIDVNQQVSSCLGIIHVQLSNLLPATDLCNPIYFSALDENGEYVLIKDHLQLENYCGIQDVSFSKTHFNCLDLSKPGTFTQVPIVISLVNGGTIACNLKLVVFDGSGPTITCPANKNLTLPLTGSLTITPQLLGISAKAICETPKISLSKTNLTCLDIGETTVIATATTIDGDIAISPVNVILSDPLKACSPQAYCKCQGENSEVFIDELQFAEIQNSSGNDGGYGDFTALYTNVQIGDKYLFSLSTAGPDQLLRNVFADVWIDWNRNGIFERTELMMHKRQKSMMGRSWIRIPQKAKVGATRMRVVIGFAAPPNPCGDILIGEVEDYTLIISPAGAGEARSLETQIIEETVIPERVPSEELHVYSNPSNNQMQIEVPRSMRNGIIYISNVFGQVIQQISYDEIDDSIQRIDVSNFESGIFYVTIRSEKSILTKSILVVH